MKAYSTLYKIYDHYNLGFKGTCEYEVLNELKDLSSRKDENCLYHTRFLFEYDDCNFDVQMKEIFPEIKDFITRATYSGNKSIHFIVEFDRKYEYIFKKFYKETWIALANTIFNVNGHIPDSQCKNPARLTRRPGAYREDKKKYQTCIYNAINVLDFYDTRLNAFRSTLKALIQSTLANTKTNVQKRLERVYDGQNTEHNGICINYDVIQHYLNTSYNKISGNGDSSISLFKAIRTCMKYNDTETLEKILNKARSEQWTEKEIDHIIDNMSKYID